MLYLLPWLICPLISMSVWQSEVRHTFAILVFEWRKQTVCHDICIYLPVQMSVGLFSEQYASKFSMKVRSRFRPIFSTRLLNPEILRIKCWFDVRIPVQMADGPKIIHGITRGCNLRMNHIGDNLYRVVMLQQYRVITQTEQTEPVLPDRICNSKSRAAHENERETQTTFRDSGHPRQT